MKRARDKEEILTNTPGPGDLRGHALHNASTMLYEGQPRNKTSAQCPTHGVLSTSGPAANADANTAATAKNEVIVFMGINARRTDRRLGCQPSVPRRLFYRCRRGGASFQPSPAEVPSGSSRTRSHQEIAPPATRQRTCTGCISQKVSSSVVWWGDVSTLR